MVPTCWLLDRPENFVDREWAGEIVVLNTRTGDTHLLSPAASAIYRLLQIGPQSHVTLSERQDAESSLADRADLPELVESTLQEFFRLGLITSSSVENC